MASISLTDALGTAEVRRETAEAQAAIDYSSLERRVAAHLVNKVRLFGPTTGRVSSQRLEFQELPRGARQDDVATSGAVNAEAGGQEKDHPQLR